MAQEMTGRERILAAIGHNQPDKTPIDLGGTRDSSIVVEGYEKLKGYFGVHSRTLLTEKMMRAVFVDEDILVGLDIDTRGVFPGPPTPGLGVSAKLEPHGFRDPWGVERFHEEGNYYYEQREYPLSGAISVSDIKKYPWPDPDDPGYLKGLKDRVAWIREKTDAAAILALPPPLVHLTQYLRGFQDWFMDFVTDTKIMEALFDAVLEVTCQMARNLLLEVGQDVDIVIFEDDLGGAKGLLVSPDDFRRFIKPRLAKYMDVVKAVTPAKVLMHSCGSVAAIIDDLIDIGIDALNPVQVSAVGMDPVQLKKKYHGKMAFWGAMDTTKVLNKGSVSDVKRTVEERIEQMGEGGGYILSAVHNIQPDVPLENVITMFRHAREYVPSFAR